MEYMERLDYVILEIWGHLLHSDSMQFGFKEHLSTTQCSWLVMEVCGYYVRKGTSVICTLLDCSKAFDKCLFDKLFQKMIKRKVPPIVIRVLVFVYEEQEGCVKLAGVSSATFSITNGTRQGSVLSPTLFSVYLDDLLVLLRKEGLGCHVSGVWMGAAGYADDLVLLAPTRETMAKMLEVCEDYARDHNLVFSCDDNPVKSKSKTIYMCGRSGKNVPESVPVNLQLYGKNLPWVPSATHLGHELHQSCSMDYDCKIKRAQFIDNSVETRETFAFAYPDQILKAVHMYSLHCYGGMLWDFTSDQTGQFCRAWNTCVKLSHRVPRGTKTFLVENFLAANFDPVVIELFARYVKFVKTLSSSPSHEVQHLFKTVSKDIGSTTGKNIHKIQRVTGADPYKVTGSFIRNLSLKAEIPASDNWRIPLLEKLLERRLVLESDLLNTDAVELWSVLHLTSCFSIVCVHNLYATPTSSF